MNGLFLIVLVIALLGGGARMLKKVIVACFIIFLFSSTAEPVDVLADEGNNVLIHITLPYNVDFCFFSAESSLAQIGTEVILEINQRDRCYSRYQFSHWTSDANIEFLDAISPVTTFVVPDNYKEIVIYAIFITNETFVLINSTGGTECSLPTHGYSFEIGTVVPIGACGPRVGHRFSHWDVYPADLEITDATALSTTIIVPYGGARVTAVFVPRRTTLIITIAGLASVVIVVISGVVIKTRKKKKAKC